MNQSFPQDVLDQIAREILHFDNAPAAFLEAWKRGIQIAGVEWFGDGTHAGLQQARSKWELRPNLPRVSSEQRPADVSVRHGQLLQRR